MAKIDPNKAKIQQDQMNQRSPWEFRFFGFRLGPDVTEEKKQAALNQQNFAIPPQDDGSVIVEEGGRSAYYMDLDGAIRDDNGLITRYRSMALHPELDTAIEDLINEAIVHQDDEPIVDLNLGLMPRNTKPLQSSLQKVFQDTLKLLDFDNQATELFRRWYIDSKMYLHIMIDETDPSKGIQDIRQLDPVRTRKVKKIQKGMNDRGVEIIVSERDTFVYNELAQSNMVTGLGAPLTNGLEIAPDAICYVNSGLYDAGDRRIIGYLFKAIKPLNQLRMVEDAMVIYRISRAPERRVFYIDCGNLPKIKADQHMRDTMNRFRNKMVYDATTGEIRDDRNFLSMMEDIWLPRQQGNRATEIVTLPPGQNLSQIEDVEYFQERLMRSLNVPFSRLLMGRDTRYTIGHSSELTRDEVKYSKFVAKLRKKFSEIFIQIMRVQAVLTNVCTTEEWDEEIKQYLRFDFQTDSYFTELKESEVIESRAALAAELEPFVGEGRYLSKEWIRTKIFKITDEEAEEIKKQVEEESEFEDEQAEEEHQKQIELIQAQGGPNEDVSGISNNAPGGVKKPSFPPNKKKPPGGFPKKKVKTND